MTPLDDLNSRFIYSPDKRDKWSILKGDGELRGDCEDYSLTLAWMLSDRSLLKLFWNLLICKFILWHCTKNNEGHVVLYYKGQWVDNITKKWSSSLDDSYRLSFPYISIIAIFFYLVKRF